MLIKCMPIINTIDRFDQIFSSSSIFISIAFVIFLLIVIFTQKHIKIEQILYLFILFLNSLFGRNQEEQSSVAADLQNKKKMVTLVSRTGRQFQRYNKGGRRLVVGCIPYRYRTGGTIIKGTGGGKIIEHEDQVEVLVISSQKGLGKGMMFPKGGWEVDETREEAARRESLEEAGVCGRIQNLLGRWSYKSKSHDTIYEGYMYSLLVTEQLDLWPEKNARHRQWMNVADAREACRDTWMKEALDKLSERLSITQQDQHHLVDATVPVQQKNIASCMFATQNQVQL